MEPRCCGRCGSRIAFHFGVFALMTSALLGAAQSTETVIVVRTTSFNFAEVKVNATGEVETSGQVPTSASVEIEGKVEVCDKGRNPLFDYSTAAKKDFECNESVSGNNACYRSEQFGSNKPKPN